MVFGVDDVAEIGIASSLYDKVFNSGSQQTPVQKQAQAMQGSVSKQAALPSAQIAQTDITQASPTNDASLNPSANLDAGANSMGTASTDSISSEGTEGTSDKTDIKQENALIKKSLKPVAEVSHDVQQDNAAIKQAMNPEKLQNQAVKMGAGGLDELMGDAGSSPNVPTSHYNTIFGPTAFSATPSTSPTTPNTQPLQTTNLSSYNQPTFSSVNPIQPLNDPTLSPLAMSDRNNKTNITNARRPVQEFLKQLRSL